MSIRHLLYTAIILFPFFVSHQAHAQDGKRSHRSVTIEQTVIDGKVVSSDTVILETDTIRQRPVQSKEISMELPYKNGSTLYIENTYRKLNIRRSKDNTVRLSTTAFFYGDPAFTNEQWFEKLNIHMKNTDSGISVISGGLNRVSTASTWSRSYQSTTSGVPDPPEPPVPPVATSTTGVQRRSTVGGTHVYGYATTDGTFSRGNWISSGNTVAVFDERGNTSYSSTNLKRELTIYIPAGTKLNVTSKYADVSVDHDLADIHARISNASLDMLNVGTARITGTYSNVTASNMDNADISVTSGKLFLKDVKQLQLNTRYTKVEAGNCGTLKLQSVSDDYDIDEVKNFSGQKTYGNLRIDKLTGSFNLKGTSADLKIRNIEPAVSTITIDNKYADVRLPVTGLKNYEVAFSGQYSSVFAPFERKEDTAQNRATKKTDNSTIRYTTSEGTLVSLTKPGSEQVGTVLRIGSDSSAYSDFVTDWYDSVKKTNNNNITYTRTDGTVLSAIKPGTASPNRFGHFTAAVGDIKGTHTIFNLTCASCNVDFK